MRHKRIPGRRSQGREQSERLSRRPAFPPRGVSLLERKGLVIGSIGVVVGLVVLSMSNAVAARIDFSKPLVIGYASGDDWEPNVAADGSGNVYVAWGHYGGVPGCATCSSPAAMIEVSHDGGKTWGAPKPLNPTPNPQGDFQVDLQVAVNSAGVVFVAYLDGKNTVAQRSEDHGETFTAPIAVNGDVKNGPTDKVGLAVRGSDVYVSYSVAQKFFVASSHDGGKTFASVQINHETSTYGWTLTSGGAVDSHGTVYFSWVGIKKSGNALGLQDLFVTKSSDGGQSWTTSYADRGVPPGPEWKNCCGWDFWGPQIVVTIDASDRVYVLYNAGTRDSGPPSVWYRSSSDGGASWSTRIAIHSSLGSTWALFPAIEGGKTGEVHVAWMDNRTGQYNMWYRTSADGGATWSREIQVSQFASGFPYKTADGFTFPYGDYDGMAWDGTHIHLAWGEGPSYHGPGNVWYATS